MFDRDGDGVPDDQDNCPTIANDQHDEDADTLGDACDPCPQLAGSAVDSDGDGIGNLCDPNPNTAGDVMVRFEPFATGTGLPAGWSADAGTASDWKVNQDRLQLADSAVHAITFDAGGEHTTIDVLVELSTPGNSPAFGALTAVADTTLDDLDTCQLEDDQLVVLKTQNGTTSTQVSASKLSVFPGAFRIVAKTSGNATSCAWPGTGVQLGGVVTGSVGKRVGVTAQDFGVAITSITIYRSP